MGMDVYGNDSDEEVGEVFRLNGWTWRRLAEYMCTVAPKVTSECREWYSNDGDGLSEERAKQLAKILVKELASGRTARYIRKQEEPTFDRKTVKDFVAFLQHCGGFRIC